jgi:hypothetical protein
MRSNRTLRLLMLGLGLIGGASAQAEEASIRVKHPNGYRQSIFEHWRNSQNEGAKPKANSAGPATAATPSPSVATKPDGKEQSTRVVADEQKIYLQRLEACTKLREAAIEKGDDDLMRQADDLEMQATEVYRRKISALPGSASLTMERLERRLGGSATPLDSERKSDASKASATKSTRKGESR